MRLIIVCDDSSNNPSPSNAFRFCEALDHSEQSQRTHYQSVQWGTMNRLEACISDSYAFITYNYQPGDKIFIFGVAGAAFAARVLANFVARFGVIVTGFVSHKTPVFAYQVGKLDDFNLKVRKIKPTESCDFHLPPQVYDVEIEVVGCWETTSSVAASAEFKHFDASLRKGIKHAFHALALDECRGPFTPALWHLPDDPAVANSMYSFSLTFSLADVPPFIAIDLQQCWFPGAHANVGGGYRDRALSNITLAWMVDLCRPFLSFNSTYINYIIEGGRRPAEWHKRIGEEVGEFNTEYQGWGRGMCYDSYSEGQTWTWKTRTPGGYGDGTNETVHASARERWQSSRERGLTTGPAVWNPNALQGFTPRQMNGSDEWEWVKNDGGITIPEAPFPTAEESYEWQLRYDIPSKEPEAISKSMYGPMVERCESLETKTRPKYSSSCQRAPM